MSQNIKNDTVPKLKTLALFTEFVYLCSFIVPVLPSYRNQSIDLLCKSPGLPDQHYFAAFNHKFTPV